MIVQREVMPNVKGQFLRAKRSSLPEIRNTGKINDEETIDEQLQRMQSMINMQNQKVNEFPPQQPIRNKQFLNRDQKNLNMLLSSAKKH